jgi:hypothetical protein
MDRVDPIRATQVPRTLGFDIGLPCRDANVLPAFAGGTPAER